VVFAFDAERSEFEIVAHLKDEETGEKTCHCAHSLSLFPDGRIFVGENDNPKRSSYLWETTPWSSTATQSARPEVGEGLRRLKAVMALERVCKLMISDLLVQLIGWSTGTLQRIPGLSLLRRAAAGDRPG
jgi:hypothetical protein